MEISLAGRTAIITGGSKGLGLATAKQFAASGADVAIVARGDDALEAAKHKILSSARGKVVAFNCDVRRMEDIQRAFDRTIAELGKIDIVVNNAGRAAGGPFESLTDEAWQADLDLKLFAAIRLTRLAWPQMRARRWGRVINVLATTAKTPSANSAPSSVSRAAGMALTKVLAGEGAPHNVLCNALLVGSIESGQVERNYEVSGQGESYEDFKRKMGEGLPLGRIGTAEEFAATACFLASDQAGYLNGVAINVDGGASPAV